MGKQYTAHKPVRLARHYIKAPPYHTSTVLRALILVGPYVFVAKRVPVSVNGLCSRPAEPVIFGLDREHNEYCKSCAVTSSHST